MDDSNTNIYRSSAKKLVTDSNIQELRITIRWRELNWVLRTLIILNWIALAAIFSILMFNV